MLFLIMILLLTHSIWIYDLSMRIFRKGVYSMPLKLVSASPDESELKRFSIYIDDETQDPWPLDEDGNPEGEGFEEIVFWLARLPSSIVNQINDEIFSYDKEGRSTLKLGTSTSRKVFAAVKKWEGVVDSHGTPAPLTIQAFKQLPVWAQQELIEEINVSNNLAEVQRQD